jgi:hypothetical protein
MSIITYFSRLPRALHGPTRPKSLISLRPKYVVKVTKHVAIHYAVFSCLLSLHSARLKIFIFKTRKNNKKLPGISSSTYKVSSVTNCLLNYCHVTDMTVNPALHVKWKSQITYIFKGGLDNPSTAAQTFLITALVM